MAHRSMLDTEEILYIGEKVQGGDREWIGSRLGGDAFHLYLRIFFVLPDGSCEDISKSPLLLFPELFVPKHEALGLAI